MTRRIQRAGCSVGRIRVDRIVDKALTGTAGTDPLHLALVFGICHNTAARYIVQAPAGLHEQLASLNEVRRGYACEQLPEPETLTTQPML